MSLPQLKSDGRFLGRLLGDLPFVVKSLAEDETV
jgi:hypothetical protein